MDERTPQLGHPEDLPPPLVRIAERYAAQPVPRPTPETTARLVERLLTIQSHPTPGAEAGWVWRAPRALRVARWRLRLLGTPFWCAGVALVGLAGAATPDALRHDAALPLILVAPLTAVLGLAHAMRTPSRGLREVEASAPASFAEVSSGLALALVTFDCLLCAAVSAGLALLRLAPFAALAAAWLGPLLLLAGISLPVALRYGVRVAALVGGGPWLFLALCGVIAPRGPLASLLAIPADTGGMIGRLLAAAIGVAMLAWPLARGATFQAAAVDTSG